MSKRDQNTENHKGVAISYLKNNRKKKEEEKECSA